MGTSFASPSPVVAFYSQTPDNGYCTILMAPFTFSATFSGRGA